MKIEYIFSVFLILFLACDISFASTDTVSKPKEIDNLSRYNIKNEIGIMLPGPESEGGYGVMPIEDVTELNIINEATELIIIDFDKNKSLEKGSKDLIISELKAEVDTEVHDFTDLNISLEIKRTVEENSDEKQTPLPLYSPEVNLKEDSQGRAESRGTSVEDESKGVSVPVKSKGASVEATEPQGILKKIARWFYSWFD